MSVLQEQDKVNNAVRGEDKKEEGKENNGKEKEMGRTRENSDVEGLLKIDFTRNRKKHRDYSKIALKHLFRAG